MDDIRLFSYKMTHDTGFSPNPFHGFLTLANCKPGMRKSKEIGDWIAGFTSKTLNKDRVGDERLVYLMKVTEKIPYDKYWNDVNYKSKIPDSSISNIINKAGDNIYKPTKKDPKTSADYDQVDKRNHNEDDKNHDLNGKFVLISNNFYYFGSSPIQMKKDIRPETPEGPTYHGVRTDIRKAEKFIRYIENKYHTGILNMPHNWPKKDSEDQKKLKKCK